MQHYLRHAVARMALSVLLQFIHSCPLLLLSDCQFHSSICVPPLAGLHVAHCSCQSGCHTCCKAEHVIALRLNPFCRAQGHKQENA